MPKYSTKEKNMEQTVAVFKSRTDAFALFDALKLKGITAKVIPTPHTAKVGCGLSVKFSYNFYYVRTLIYNLQLKSFVGFYKI